MNDPAPPTPRRLSALLRKVAVRRWGVAAVLRAAVVFIPLVVMLPAVFGHILTGLRLAIGVVWIVLVPCEMLGVNEGLGYFILDTRDRLAYSELMAAIVLIGALGWLLDAATRKLHSRWVH